MSSGLFHFFKKCAVKHSSAKKKTPSFCDVTKGTNTSPPRPAKEHPRSGVSSALLDQLVCVTFQNVFFFFFFYLEAVNRGLDIFDSGDFESVPLKPRTLESVAVFLNFTLVLVVGSRTLRNLQIRR